MPISGLVLVFRKAFDQFPEARTQLEQHPAVELGAVRENKCAIVTEAESSEEDQRLWNWLYALPGVESIQIAFVGFDESEDERALKSPLGEWKA